MRTLNGMIDGALSEVPAVARRSALHELATAADNTMNAFRGVALYEDATSDLDAECCVRSIYHLMRAARLMGVDLDAALDGQHERYLAARQKQAAGAAR